MQIFIREPVGANRYLIWSVLIIGLYCNRLIAKAPEKNLPRSSSIMQTQQSQEPAKLELIKLLEQSKFINAHFTQDIISSDFTVLQRQRGKVKLKKPNLLNWEILSPEHSQIIIDGKYIWYYEPDLNQVIVKDLQQQSAQNILIQLLLNQLDFKSFKFMVNYWSNKSDGFKHKSFIINPVPAKTLQQLDFAKCYVKFNQYNQLVFVRVIDQLSQQIDIKFFNFKNNLDDAVFKFVVPDEADVIKDY